MAFLVEGFPTDGVIPCRGWASTVCLLAIKSASVDGPSLFFLEITMTEHQTIAKPEQATAPKGHRFLRRAQVRDRLNIGDTKLKALIKAGAFPAPIHLLDEQQLPGRVSFWLEADIEAYMAAQIEANRARMAEIANDGINGWLTQAVNAVKETRHV